MKSTPLVALIGLVVAGCQVSVPASRIAWRRNWDQALQEAASSKKPLFIKFYTDD